MKASEIIEAFGAQEDDKRRTGYRALCPAHEKTGDHSPSLILDFNPETRKALAHCESRKCDLEDILLGAGLSPRDLHDVSYIGQSVRSMTGAATKTPASAEARASAGATAYRYAANIAREVAARPDGEVATLLRKGFGITPETLTTAAADELGVGLDDNGWLTVTARDVDGTVAFTQFRNPEPGASPRWLTERSPDERSRWNAAGFIGRRHSDGLVLIAEGSSDALALAALDRYDVVAIRGASLGERVREVASEFVGRDVVIAVDNDEAGRTLTKRLLAILAPMTKAIAYARFPEGFDVRDFRDEDPATFGDRLAALIAEAAAYEPEVEFDIRPYLTGADADRAAAIVDYAKARGMSIAFTDSHGWLVYDGTVWDARAEAHVWQLAVSLGQHIRKAAVAERSKGYEITDEAEARARREEDDQRAKAIRDSGAAEARPYEERAAALARQARSYLTASAIKAALEVARTAPGVHAEADDFDAHPDLLGVGNGVVDLRTGTLRPMRSEDRITRRLAVNYNPEAKAPRWERFLREVLVDEGGRTSEDLVGYMQAMTGYGLTGHTSEQFFAIFTGTGANGKSAYLNVIGEVCAEVTQRTPFSTFEQRTGGGGIPNDLAALKSARYVFASESDAGTRMSEALLKAVTGEDTITARFMRQEFFSYRPAFLLVLATNHLPRFLGQDNGLWRRVRLVEWKRQFADHEQDRGLASRIAAEEGEGVLAWLVAGARAWYDAGRKLPESPTVAAASKGYREDSDILGEFLAANVVKTGNKRDVAFLGDLHARFLAWQEATNESYRPGVKIFGRMLDERWGAPPRNAFPKHWKSYRLLAETQVKANFARARRELLGGAPEIEGTPLTVPEAEFAVKYADRFPGAAPKLFSADEGA